jgi:hypothetical protein
MPRFQKTKKGSYTNKKRRTLRLRGAGKEEKPEEKSKKSVGLTRTKKSHNLSDLAGTSAEKALRRPVDLSTLDWSKIDLDVNEKPKSK